MEWSGLNVTVELFKTGIADAGSGPFVSDGDATRATREMIPCFTMESQAASQDSESGLHTHTHTHTQKVVLFQVNDDDDYYYYYYYQYYYCNKHVDEMQSFGVKLVWHNAFRCWKTTTAA